jgi:hypothetical protein
MKNIEMKLKGQQLVITVDLTKDFGMSKSGKSITIASTEGNISVPEHEDIKIGLNIYKKKIGSSRSGVGESDEPGIFCGGCLPSHPHMRCTPSPPKDAPEAVQ